MRCGGSDNPLCVRCKSSGVECTFEKIVKGATPVATNPELVSLFEVYNLFHHFTSRRISQLESQLGEMKTIQTEMQMTLKEILTELRHLKSMSTQCLPAEGPSLQYIEDEDQVNTKPILSSTRLSHDTVYNLNGKRGRSTPPLLLCSEGEDKKITSAEGRPRSSSSISSSTLRTFHSPIVPNIQNPHPPQYELLQSPGSSYLRPTPYSPSTYSKLRGSQTPTSPQQSLSVDKISRHSSVKAMFDPEISRSIQAQCSPGSQSLFHPLYPVVIH
jgi:hypothetical protein